MVTIPRSSTNVVPYKFTVRSQHSWKSSIRVEPLKIYPLKSLGTVIFLYLLKFTWDEIVTIESTMDRKMTHYFFDYSNFLSSHDSTTKHLNEKTPNMHRTRQGSTNRLARIGTRFSYSLGTVPGFNFVVGPGPARFYLRLLRLAQDLRFWSVVVRQFWPKIFKHKCFNHDHKQFDQFQPV